MAKKQHSFFKESTNQDYLCLFGTYLHKRLLKLLLFLLLLIPVGLLTYAIMETYRLTTLNEREKITYRYDDARLNTIEGYVIIVNEANEMVYEGQFANGKCNGEGIVYQAGEVRYVGKLVDNTYEDEKGKLYEQGTLIYEGGFVKGMYEGEGFLYYPSGTYQAQGTFQHGELNGTGIEYNEDESILREGEYLYGRLNGQGVSYYEGTNIRHYEGEFMGNTPVGEGTLFTTSGRAWYNGLVYDYEPDYESYIGATFEDVRSHFLDPIQLYTTSNNSAMLIPKQQVAFLSDTPYLKQETETQESKEEITNTEDAKESSIDEATYFIESIVLLSDALSEEDQEPYEEALVDGSYAFSMETNTLNHMDLYAMVLSKTVSEVTPLDAFIKVEETKQGVTSLILTSPELYVDRYVLTYHGLAQQITMLGDSGLWNYEILSEREEVSE